MIFEIKSPDFLVGSTQMLSWIGSGMTWKSERELLAESVDV